MTAATLNLELAASAAVYPQKLDPECEFVLLIRMSEVDYRSASFLDDRVLTNETEGRWFAYADVRVRAEAAVARGPLYFIFHSGHVGSTLLSRLLDEAPGVLGLREPLPLRSLADAHDQARPDFPERLETFIRLWRRGFENTRKIIIKATSTAGRIAPALIDARADSKAIYLNVKAETYLATLLAGANSANDLRGFSAERMGRLSRLLGDRPVTVDAHSVGELAAAAWLTERLTQQRAKGGLGERLLEADFGDLLEHREMVLARVARHFDLANPAGFASRAVRSAVWTRYAKAPGEYAYSPELRAEILDAAAREHAPEIRAGMALIERLAKEHAGVASLL